jgi:hypothetical protein
MNQYTSDFSSFADDKGALPHQFAMEDTNYREKNFFTNNNTTSLL